MISAWEVYLFTRLDAVEGLCVFMVFTGLCAMIPLIIAYFAAEMHELEDDDKVKVRFIKWIKRSLALIAASVLIASIVPNTKEAAVIYLLPKIANNEQVQKVPENFVKLLNTKMEAWIADFEKDKKK